MVREETTNDGEEGDECPIAPFVFPARSACENREEESAGEVARDETKKADHGPDALSHEDGGNCGNDKQSKEGTDCTSTRSAPPSSHSDRQARANDEDCGEEGCHLREPCRTKHSDYRARDQIDDADAPPILMEPAILFSLIYIIVVCGVRLGGICRRGRVR